MRRSSATPRFASQVRRTVGLTDELGHLTRSLAPIDVDRSIVETKRRSTDRPTKLSVNAQLSRK